MASLRQTEVAKLKAESAAKDRELAVALMDQSSIMGSPLYQPDDVSPKRGGGKASPAWQGSTGGMSSGSRTYGTRGMNPSPTGYVTPATYERKMAQALANHDMAAQIRLKETLQEERDRHTDTVELVLKQKEAECAKQLADQAARLEVDYERQLLVSQEERNRIHELEMAQQRVSQ